MDYSGCDMKGGCGFSIDLDEGEKVVETNEKHKRKTKGCIVCGGDVNLVKVLVNKGGEQYFDWRVICDSCGLIDYKMPADNFHGRPYYASMDDAIFGWNEMVEANYG